MATTFARRLVIGSQILKNSARAANARRSFQQCKKSINNHHCLGSLTLSHSLHTSRSLSGLEEFYDDPDTFEEDKVPCGRPWLKDELRLKGNTDLHKLWYVLLKERNRLLTMDALYKDACLNMPSPERIDKVEESMENLAAVVNERDSAHELLETGRTSEPKPVWRKTILNTWRQTYESEHYEPKHKNAEYMRSIRQNPKWMVKYKKLLREKEMRKEKLRQKAQTKELEEMSEAFPHLQLNAKE